MELPTGAIGVPYKVNGNPVVLSTSGGTGTYTWSISSGSLPPGLSLNAQSAVISGTPTGPYGFSIFTVKVTDSAGMSGTQTLHIYIEGVVIVSSTCGTGQVANQCPSGSVGVPYMQTLTASGGQAPYQWALASGSNPLPAGLALDPATCTNSTGTCIISGVPTMNAAPTTFTLQVTDSETSPGVPAVGLATFTITIMSITTTSLPTGFANVPYSSGTLTVAGGSTPYSWCVMETNGSCDNGTGGGPDCGTSNFRCMPPGLTLDPSCTRTKLTTCAIDGTPTLTGNYSPTFQVTDGEMQNPATSTAQVSISIAPAVTDAALSGNYVFTFSGFNNGTPVVMAGGFVADGKGNITSGLLDYNDGTGEPINGAGRPIPQAIQAGAGSVYSITANGLGTMTLTTNMAVFNFAIAIRSDGSGGRLIQSDSHNPKAYGSGTIMGTTPLAQGEQWPLCSSYIALGLYGWNSSLTARYAAAGQFQFSPVTCVDLTGTMDINNGGTLSNATFSAAFNEYDSSTSRGIAGFTFNGDQNHRYFNPFYLVSNGSRKINQVALVTENDCDPKLNCPGTNPTLWSGLQQASNAQCPGPPNRNNFCLNGTEVVELNALDTKGTASVTAGLFASKGDGNATFNFDQNQGGVCNSGTCSQPQSSQGTYSVDKTTGRVTLGGFSSAFDGFLPILYLVGPNQAFVVGTDPAVTSGYFEQQTGSSFTNSSLLGLYQGGTISPITANVTNGVSWLYADGGGNINGAEDTSGPGGPGGPSQVTYTYAVDSTGRTLVCASGTCSAQSNNIIGVAYVVSPTKFVLLPATDPNPALSVFGQ